MSSFTQKICEQLATLKADETFITNPPRHLLKQMFNHLKSLPDCGHYIGYVHRIEETMISKDHKTTFYVDIAKREWYEIDEGWHDTILNRDQTMTLVWYMSYRHYMASLAIFIDEPVTKEFASKVLYASPPKKEEEELVTGIQSLFLKKKN